MRFIWIICSFLLLILVLLRVPTKDSNELQTTDVALGLTGNSQPPLTWLEGGLWFLTFLFLLLSTIIVIK